MSSRFIWVLSLAALGCTGAGMSAYQPAKVKTDFAEEDLFSATVKVLEQNGYVAQPDLDTYSVTTREKEVSVSSVPKLSYKFTWQVKTKGGVLIIDSTCQENSATARTEFEDCGDERPEKLIDEQAALKAAILKQSKLESAPAP